MLLSFIFSHIPSCFFYSGIEYLSVNSRMAGFIINSTFIIKTAKWCEWLPISVIQQDLIKGSDDKGSNFRAN